MFSKFFQGFASRNDDYSGEIDVDETGTGIVFISAHGGLFTKQIEGVSEPKLVQVPYTMEVIKISLATPGVANIANETDMVGYYNLIIEVFENLSNPNIPISDLKQILNELIKKFKLQLNEIAESLYADDGDNTKKEERDDDKVNFKLHVNKAFKVFYLNPGDFIVNKVYLRTESDIAPCKTKINFRVLSLSREHGLEDLLSKNNQEITTEEIMKHFLINGTRRLIIFDFSCSTCFTYSDRDTRGLRRMITRDNIPYGGKRTRKNKRKMKRNKYKKTHKNLSN